MGAYQHHGLEPRKARIARRWSVDRISSVHGLQPPCDVLKNDCMEAQTTVRTGAALLNVR
jgi:hypothetical protein